MLDPIIKKSLLIGLLSSFLGTLFMSGGFMLMIRVAELWSGMQFPNHTLAGIWHSSPGFVLFAIVGVWIAWFAFAAFITYSQLSSKRDERTQAGGE